MNKWRSRLQDPLTYVGFAAFGSIFGIKELAALGVPEVATQLAAVAGIIGSLFGATTEEKRHNRGE